MCVSSFLFLAAKSSADKYHRHRPIVKFRGSERGKVNGGIRLKVSFDSNEFINSRLRASWYERQIVLRGRVPRHAATSHRESSLPILNRCR